MPNLNLLPFWKGDKGDGVQQIADASNPDAGPLDGAEYATVSRGAGVLKTTLTNIAQFARAPLSDANDVDKGDAMVAVKKAFSGSVARTQHDQNEEFLSVLDAGADSTGVASAAAPINAVITATPGGTLTIPPGTYNVGDITIQSKAAGSGVGAQGAFRIEASGAKFTGGGKIIVDSCKRVQINGLDAPLHDLVWRGQWWGKYSNMRFRHLVMNDVAGTVFSSNYWSSIDTCVFQAVIHHSSSTDNSNAITFENCAVRGNQNQGFAGTADYAIQLDGNQNVQDWEFINCDISYHNLAIYNIGAGNTTGQVELSFIGCYFDTLYPAPINRAASRVLTDRCHTANDQPNSSALAAIARGAHDAFRTDRAAGWKTHSGINLIPNGDFRVGLPTYAGSGLPVGASGGATITETTGGAFGRALDLNQATGGTTFYRAPQARYTGRHTARMVFENLDASAHTFTMSFAGLTTSVTAQPNVPVYWTLTSGADIAAGTQMNIGMTEASAAAYHIKVHEVGVHFGEGGMPMALATPFTEMVGSATYNPPSLAAGASTTTTVTVTGAVFADYITGISFGIDTQGIEMKGRISAADTVTVTLTNPTAGTIDLASSTLRVNVKKSVYPT